MFTPINWAETLLARMSLPITDNNIRALVAFQAQEGGHNNGAYFNPLNTTLRTKESVNFKTGLPGSGVQAYVNWNEGLEATAKTLSQQNMRMIVESLRRNESSMKTIAQVAISPWGWWDSVNGHRIFLPHAVADAVIASATWFKRFGSQPFRDPSSSDTWRSGTRPRWGAMTIAILGSATFGLGLLVYGVSHRSRV